VKSGKDVALLGHEGMDKKRVGTFRPIVIGEAPSDIHPLGTDFTEKSQDLVEGHNVSLDLTSQWGVMRGLEDDLEGAGMLLLRCRKDSLIPSADDRVAGGVGVDLGTNIAGEDRRG
jgi:hypothetical protein